MLLDPPPPHLTHHFHTPHDMPAPLLLPNLFLQKEASEVFFAATKLFQNQDMNLRRMVYLCIKDICPSADEVIIVTSSLMKDMNSKVQHIQRSCRPMVVGGG
jgi:hypothetical protein